jgi:hypothetical protein
LRQLGRHHPDVTRCQVSMSQPQLQVEALVALPTPDEEQQKPEK